MPNPRSPRRWTAALTCLTVSVTLAATAAANPAGATGPGLAGTGAPPTHVAAPAVEPAASYQLRLLTGDLVEYTPDPGGAPGVVIEPAPRPDDTPVTYRSFPDGDGGFLVVPSDAAPLLADGTLDPQLFDLEVLVADGRTAEAGPLPLIVEYADPADPATLAEVVEPGHRLASLGAATVTVDPSTAGGFWSALRDGTAGVETVWLDRSVHPYLHQSAATVGAPAAHRLGLDGEGVTIAIIDSGIDESHPDFAGRIVATANFTDDPDLTDHLGHGTHAASVAAGSGAASGGVNTGIAPAASLLVAKVFDQHGHSETGRVIAAMEWAAAQGADVVNLSLGVCCGDGDDPLSRAVDTLTAQYGTLFVAGMGNDGQRDRVPAPAAADHALAVGAGDKATGTRVVGSSNGGPRFPDGAVKPNLVAPGDGILAARATGVTGAPVDDPWYVTRGGTSAATPHVAGAAALLAQQHPEWTAEQLRDALVSSAATLEQDTYRWFDQGAGRLDVARAVTQPVRATAGTDLGVLDPEAGPVTRPVTYRNTGEADVALTLSVRGQGWSGGPAPAGAVTLSTDRLTVPAGGEATLEVTVDPAAGGPGAYGGWIQAGSADGEIQLTTTFSYYSGPPIHTLDVQVVNGYGTAELSDRAWFILRPVRWEADPDNPWNPGQVQTTANAQGRIRFQVPAGTYELLTSIPEEGVRGRHSLVRQEITLTSDRSVTVSGADTVPVVPVTGEPTTVAGGQIRYLRDNGDARGPGGMTVTVAGRNVPHGMWVTPLAAPGVGTHQLSYQWTLDQGLLVRATTFGVAGLPSLAPVYHPDRIGDRLAGTRTYPVEFVGAGTPEELAGRDLTGKLALLAVPVDPADPTPYGSAAAALEAGMTRALAEGAAGAVGYLDVDGAVGLPPAVTGLTLGVSAEVGRALRAAATGPGLTLTLTGRDAPEHTYLLRHDHQHAAPELPVRVDAAELARVETAYHADRADAPTATETVRTDGPGGPLAPPGTVLAMPTTRAFLIGPGRPEVVWTRQLNHDRKNLRSDDVFAAGEHRPVERWFRAPLLPGAPELPAGAPVPVLCGLCRDGDRFVPASYWLDSDPGRWVDIPTAEASSALFRITDEGEERMPLRYGVPRSFIVPDEPGWYRLESVEQSRRTLAERVTTVATFHSGPPAGQPDGYRCTFGDACQFQPVPQPRYDLPLDLFNTAPAGQEFTFGLTVGTHPAVVDPPAVTSVVVEYSVDDGVTWLPAQVTTSPDGRHQVRVEHPVLADTSGFVSLRVVVEDATGGSLTQTVIRAYGLR